MQKTASMAKLTRYTSFERLKLDEKSSTKISTASNKQVSELEEFMNLLRRKLLARKKNGNTKISNG